MCVKAASDNDKVRCNAVRAIGIILYLCPEKHILSDTALGLNALIDCATDGNDMKVSFDIILLVYRERISRYLVKAVCYQHRLDIYVPVSLCNKYFSFDDLRKIYKRLYLRCQVRWNACRALGLVLSHHPDAILPPSWKVRIYFEMYQRMSLFC